MKTYRNIFIAAAVALAASSCNETFKTDIPTTGKLSFEGFEISTDGLQAEIQTKSQIEAPGTYNVNILDMDDNVIVATTYAQVKSSGYGIELKAGNYKLEVNSGTVPEAAFESPVYGANDKFAITAGQTTKLASVVCKVKQTAVTVSYDSELLAEMTGDGTATVEVMNGFPLKYELKYNGGDPTYDKRIGYFSVEDGSNSLIVTFAGQVNGSSQKMTKMFTGIKGGDLQAITFTKKINPEGTASIAIAVNGYIEDEALASNVEAPALQVIGEDPQAPKGDGGIKLEIAPDCTMFTDLQNIVVPTLEQATMDLRLIATVPNGTKKINVHIDSTNDTFMIAVGTAGGPDLDLINPSAESEIIFQVVPFPHGPVLLDKTSINFDLSAAQMPILAYPGTHTFTIQFTDNKSCKKDVSVKMIVK